MDNYKNVRVGVGVIVKNSKNEFLMGKRLSKHEYGKYSFPGGHVEKFEDPIETSKRELHEETGLIAKSIRFTGDFTNDIFGEKHYITLYYIVDEYEGELKNMEPDKCENWDWFSVENLPQPLMIGEIDKLIYKYM